MRLYIYTVNLMAGVSSVFWKQMTLRAELLGGWDLCRLVINSNYSCDSELCNISHFDTVSSSAKFGKQDTCWACSCTEIRDTQSALLGYKKYYRFRYKDVIYSVRRIKSIERSSDLIGNLSRDHSICGMVPQPSTLLPCSTPLTNPWLWYVICIRIFSGVKPFFLILGVCILLRVWDQGEGVLPSTRR
jgi:hypothetical protein